MLACACSEGDDEEPMSASLPARQAVRSAIISGQVVSAMELLQAQCPAVLQQGSPVAEEVKFHLSCQQYIELIRYGMRCELGAHLRACVAPRGGGGCNAHLRACVASGEAGAVTVVRGTPSVAPSIQHIQHNWMEEVNSALATFECSGSMSISMQEPH